MLFRWRRCWKLSLYECIEVHSYAINLLTPPPLMLKSVVADLVVLGLKTLHYDI